MAPIRVYEVATFYDMFNLRPVGRDFGPDLHDHAVLAARHRRGRRGLRGRARHRPGRDDAGQAVLPARGRVPGGLRQRADGAVNDDFYEDLDARQHEGDRRGADARRAPGARLADGPAGPRCRTALGEDRPRSSGGPEASRAETSDAARRATAIFTNLYGEHDWHLAGARARGDWDGTKDLIPRAATGSSTRSRIRACAGAAAPAFRPG